MVFLHQKRCTIKIKYAFLLRAIFFDKILKNDSRNLPWIILDVIFSVVLVTVDALVDVTTVGASVDVTTVNSLNCISICYDQ